MVYYSLTILILLFASNQLVNAKNYMGKRDVERDYYSLNIVTPEGQQLAQLIANRLDVRYEGQLGQLPHWFMLSAPKQSLEKRDDDKVLSSFEHFKRQSLQKRDEQFWQDANIDKQIFKRRVKRAPIDPIEILKKVQDQLNIQDPLFSAQWHLINQKNPGNDINVTGVWEQGITGKGVNVAILDDGVDYSSEDLAENFFEEGSYDFNDHHKLPTPKLWDDYHGTRCAGQIAAVKNNVCGMGIAYESKVSGVRILSGELSDADEAIALNYEYQKNHIYSCSWGPADNGKTMEAPTGVLADAFLNGIKNGREGKGSIYVFATGNGAASGDNCNFDGYTNSIYTITVGAIDHNNQHPIYSESCSAQLVVSYSSGSGEYIHTTDRGKNACSDRHGGTSAAAPNAVGIFALVLSVRPDLNWRDLQHLCVQNAVPIQTEDEDWKKLPSGRIYNHKYGYGKLDAYRLVEAAKNFKSVNEQTWIELTSPLKKRSIPDSSALTIKKALKSKVFVTEEMIKAAGLLRLEHITATVNIEHQRRGDIVIDLESPNQVVSHLATERRFDEDAGGIKNWKFMTVKHWDESPLGNWTLSVFDVSSPEMKGHLINWTLTLYGELDPNFKGTPIHSPDGIHHDEEHVISSTIIGSKTKGVETTSVTDNIPSRPTRIKPDVASPAGNAIPESMNEENSNPNFNVSSIIFGVVGFIFILAIALVSYFFKHTGWNPLSKNDKSFSGYEFDVIQPLTELDENELSESDAEDDRPFREP